MNHTAPSRISTFSKIHAKQVLITCLLLVAFVYVAIAVLHYRFPIAKIQGVSMLPNFQINKTYVTERVFDFPSRFDVVVMRPDDFTIDAKSVIDGALGHVDLYVKRVVGLPGDVLVYNNVNGNLISINKVPVAYAANESIPPFFLSDKNNPTLRVTVTGRTATFEGYSVNIYEAEHDFTEMDAQEEAFIAKLRVPFIEKGEGDTTTVLVPKDNVFIMSDNRFEGVDSRHFGPVPITAMESILRREVEE